jgi:bilin biosynthesis protein
LIQALGDNNRYVQIGVAASLGKIGDTRATEPLVRAFKKANKDNRYFFSQALSLMKEAAVDPLIKALEDADWSIRYYAVLTLGKIGDPRAEAPLVQALVDENEQVRKRAEEALKNVRTLKSQPAY